MLLQNTQVSVNLRFAYQIHTSHGLDRLNLEAEGISYKKHGVAMLFQL